jgi:Kef-type K+ transport system membrane component KefB
LKRFHHHVDRQNIVLATILVASLALMPASHYARGSYLLGCFLAGLCFCTDHHTHPVWQAQVKRLLQWLMRLFFACTIGFEVRQRGFRRLSGAASCACRACCYVRKHRSTVS